jgi:hypothetical protein
VPTLQVSENLIICRRFWRASEGNAAFCGIAGFNRRPTPAGRQKRLETIPMSQERLYKRVRPTGLMSSKAKIIVAPKSPAVDCRLVDYSAGGACLELAPMVTLPARFELLYGSVRKKCRLVWRRGMRMGVTF